MKIIQCGGYSCKVDDEDFDAISKLKWYAHCPSNSHTMYAAHGKKVKGRYSQILMHRMIMNAPKGLIVDHRDGDGLNNQKSNLRLVTVQQNRLNQHTINGTSGYKGVCWNRKSKKWQAGIKVSGKSYHLGLFIDEEAAAHAYDAAAKRFFGEFAGLNFLEVA